MQKNSFFTALAMFAVLVSSFTELCAQSKIRLDTQVMGTLPPANGGTGTTSVTGSGSAVLSNSPVLTSPSLGTPSAAVLTNATGLPLTTGVVGNLPVTNLNSGTGASSSSYWRGDGTWSTPPIGSGTVTSVQGTGTVSGLSLSGTVTNAGNISLGGTLSVAPSNFSSQTANTFLASPNSASGVPTFRGIVANDVPTLNQNTTGTAANVTGTIAVANGGTGAVTSASSNQNIGGIGTGTYYANGVATTASNGISTALSQCSSLTYICTISASPVYALTELPAWSQISVNQGGLGPQSSLTQQIGMVDTRGGSSNRTYIDPDTSYSSTGWGIGEQVKAIFSKGPLAANQRYNWSNAQLLLADQTQGGLNAQLYGFNGKTTLVGGNFNLVSNTVGQRFAIQLAPHCLGPGDCVGFTDYVEGPAGFRDPGDEGIETGTAYASETINVYRGTIASGGGTGSSALVITPAGTTLSANEAINGTQGEGRWMLDTASGKVTTLNATAVSNVVQQLSSTYGYFSRITAASGITTSSAYGTLTSAVSVASTAQIPGSTSPTFSVTGTLSNGLACVADETSGSGNGNFETVNITSVSGGAFTAVFAKPHPVGAAIFQGGQCGQFAEIVQDTYPSGSSWSNGETGGTTVYPVRHPWPVLGSIDGTNLIVWTASAYTGGFNSTFSASLGSQAVNLYEGAEVYSVVGANNDTTDNHFALAPNNVVWANADTVEESHYPAQHMNGQTIQLSSFGNHHGYGSNLFLAAYVNGAENQDIGVNVANQTPYTNYTPYGGQTIVPNAAFYTQGAWRFALETNGGAHLESVLGVNASPVSPTTVQPVIETLGQYTLPSGDNISYVQQAFTSLAITSVAASSGGATTYTGTVTGGASNFYAGKLFNFYGDTTNPSNNGTFICTASTVTTLTCNNGSAVANTYSGTAAQVGGEFQIAMGQYAGTAHPALHFNQFGIVADQSSTHTIPHYGFGAYNPGTQNFEGMGHAAGVTELDEYNPSFGQSGLGVFVSAGPNDANTPSNFDYSLGRVGMFMATNKVFGWGPSGTNAGNPSNTIAPSLSWGYLSGGMQLLTSPPSAAASDAGVFDVDCSVAATCASLTGGVNVLRMTNTNTSSTGHDVLRYAPTTGGWIWSAGATGGNGNGSYVLTFSGTSGAVKLPGTLQIAGTVAASGHACLQVDSAGNVTGTGTACGDLSGTSVSIGGSALAAGACASTTVAITGATVGMGVNVTPASDPGASSYWNGFVSSAGTVTVRVCEAVAGTPAAVIYAVRVIE